MRAQHGGHRLSTSELPGVFLKSANPLHPIRSPVVGPGELCFKQASCLHLSASFLLTKGGFILSGVFSLLFSSSILGTYQPGEFLSQYPIILPFHTVHGVLQARILKWFATPFSSGPHSVRLIGKDLDAGRDWGQEEKGTTEDEMAGWHH